MTEMTNRTDESHLSKLLHLRLLVGFLGEQAQFSWWPTKFYEASSRAFLEPVFSKTSRLAQYHGVLEAARRLHDEHLNVGSYHLFRFPEEVEQDLHVMLQGSVNDNVASEVPQSKEVALQTLSSIAGTSAKTVVGPTAVGNIKDIDSADALSAIAGVYLSAFSQNTKAYPYLVP
jgi:hypothetical protein